MQTVLSRTAGASTPIVSTVDRLLVRRFAVSDETYLPSQSKSCTRRQGLIVQLWRQSFNIFASKSLPTLSATWFHGARSACTLRRTQGLVLRRGWWQR